MRVTRSAQRSSARLAALSPGAAQARLKRDDGPTTSAKPAPRATAAAKRRAAPASPSPSTEDDDRDYSDVAAGAGAAASDSDAKAPKPKKRRVVAAAEAAAAAGDTVATATATTTTTTTTTKKKVAARRRAGGAAPGDDRRHFHIFGGGAPASRPGACGLPHRRHAPAYHRPRLLDSREGRAALLAWFDGTSGSRGMPWRKPWIDPSTFPRHEQEAAAAAQPGQSKGAARDSHRHDSPPEKEEEGEDLRSRLERRAYEVWISEVMLQQTRVAVVVDYWTRWVSRWPTIRDLAAAPADDVLAAWKGLGYYSRATRIHEAARLVAGDRELAGLLPAAASELQARVPGVGRYTGGAVSAIVFGRAAPMVDGNVLRVLSRQLGVLGDVKADKVVVDTLWAAADALARAVARDYDDGGGGGGGGAVKGEKVVKEEEGEEEGGTEKDNYGLPLSDRPGRWGQALMELGSTVCGPKPNCGACPITSTCRAYNEGLGLAAQRGQATPPASIPDIEESPGCNLCSAYEEDDPADQGAAAVTKTNTKTKEHEEAAAPPKRKGQKQQTSLLQSFAFTKTTSTSTTTTTRQAARGESKLPPPPPREEETIGKAALETIVGHARRFPVKAIKKAARPEEDVVCAVRRRGDGRWLVRRRPEKGLLAGLWEFPSLKLAADDGGDEAGRSARGRGFVEEELRAAGSGRRGGGGLEHLGELGSVPWLFSHIRLTMHVHLFEVDGGGDGDGDGEVTPPPGYRWSDSVEDESMGTGMQKCWALVQQNSV